MPYDNERDSKGKVLSPALGSFFTETYISESLGKKNKEESKKTGMLGASIEEDMKRAIAGID